MTIFIGGFPRSGTTLLMTIFHRYGLDIGYTEDKIQRVIDLNEGALEWLNDRDFYREIDNMVSKTIIDRRGKTHTLETLGLKDPNTYPDVIKHPGDWEKQRSVFSRVDLSKCPPPHYGIFCLRGIKDTIQSMQKRRIEYRNQSSYKMEMALADMQFNFMRDAEQHNIRWEMLQFPWWAKDQTLFYNKLSFLGLDALKLIECHKALVDVGKIHYGLE